MRTIATAVFFMCLIGSVEANTAITITGCPVSQDIVATINYTLTTADTGTLKISTATNTSEQSLPPYGYTASVRLQGISDGSGQVNAYINSDNITVTSTSCGSSDLPITSSNMRFLFGAAIGIVFIAGMNMGGIRK